MKKAKAPEEKVVRAARFELVDRRGRVRAVVGDVGAPSTFAPGIALLDKAGRQRCVLGLFATGPTMSFVSDGNERIVFGVNDGDEPGGDDDPGYDPTAFVVFADATGSACVDLSVHADGVLEVAAASDEGPDDPG